MKLCVQIKVLNPENVQKHKKMKIFNQNSDFVK